MKSRDVTLASGQTFQVPQGIQRIDSKSTHGWQVRYQGSKFFSDGHSADPGQSLANAVLELIARIKTMPAPKALGRDPSTNKTSDLPSGISGPVVRARPGRALTAELSVLLPRFGRAAQYRKIYIGSQNTYTEDRYREALAKGIALREEAIARYERAAAKSRRESISQLRAQLATLKSTQRAT